MPRRAGGSYSVSHASTCRRVSNVPGVGAPTFKNLTSATATVSPGPTVIMPSGLKTGDICIAWVDFGGSGTITAPADWTQIDNNGAATFEATFQRVITGTEAASYQFSSTNVGTLSVAVIVHYAKGGTMAVDQHHLDTSQQNTASVAVAALTTTAAPEAWVVFLGNQEIGSVNSVTNGLGLRGSGTNGASMAWWVYDKALTATGSTGAATFSMSATGFNKTASVSVQ